MEINLSPENINVFLDTDGWTAHLIDKPWISAGGDTKEEAIKELKEATEVAKEAFGD